MIQHRTGFGILNAAKIATVVAALFVTPWAHADIVIDWPEIVVFSDNVNPVNGFADLFLTFNDNNTNDLSNPLAIDSFNIRFDLVSGTGLSFSTPQNAVINPLFDNADFVTPTVGPATTVRAANDTPSTTLGNGKGLIRAPFTVAPGNVGQTYNITINALETQLSNAGNAAVLTSRLVLQSGSITVQPQAVPEPAAIIGMGAVALLSSVGAVIGWRRKMARR